MSAMSARYAVDEGGRFIGTFHSGPHGGSLPSDPATFQSFAGTSGDDNFVGTASDDTFDLTQGGNDTVQAGDGDDVISMGATLTRNDRLDGGADDPLIVFDDTLELAGDYSSGLVLRATTITGIEQVRLDAGNNYDLTFRDPNFVAGSTIFIRAIGFSSTNWVSIDASAETDARMRLFGGPGDDILLGGHFDDQLSPGLGTDFIDGGDGIDAASFSNITSGGVTVDLRLQGTAQDIGPSTVTMVNIENLIGSSGDDILKGTDGNNLISSTAGSDIISGLGGDDIIVATRQVSSVPLVQVDGGDGRDILTFYAGIFSPSPSAQFDLSNPNAQDTGSSGILTVTGIEDVEGTWGDDQLRGDAAANTLWGADGSDRLAGRAGDDQLFGDELRSGPSTLPGFQFGSDRLIGGKGSDLLVGGALGDELSGGKGHDTFVYDQGGDSLGEFFFLPGDTVAVPAFDTITDFVGADDLLRFWFQVEAVDAECVGGRLTKHNMNSNLANAVDASHLAANHAVLYVPDRGHYSGHVFLIVDANATAGYQTGDVAIEFSEASDLTGFGIANFTTGP